MSVRELHKILVSDPNNCGIKYARDEDDNIIIIYFTLHSLLPPQFKKMSARYKVMCGCGCCISAKNVDSSLLSWCDRYLKKLKDKIQNSQGRRYGEKSYHIYETYKNTVMPHGRHIYAKASDMSKATMCIYPQSDHALPHCKYVFRYCSECPYINIPDQETNKKHEETTTSITCSIPRRPLFLHALSFECTSNCVFLFSANFSPF